MKKRGFILLNTIIFSSIAITVVYAFIGWANTSLKATRHLVAREQAFQIAEAGIDYYRWHLAHSPTDYQDGTGSPGPYIHDFKDKDGNIIGQYSLTITPPITGSTLIKIKSTGTVVSNPGVYRTIMTHLAIPSLAKYAVVANDVMRFGEGTETFGPIHANGGVRFDGLAHNLVTSAVSSYDDPDHEDSGSEKLEFGVHTHVKPPPSSGTYTNYVSAETPPNTINERSDVFMAGRSFPYPTADFVGITANISQMKTDAQSDGHYYNPSGSLGYHIVLKTNDTYDLYKVTSLTAVPNGCKNKLNEDGWGTWSIKSSGGQTLLGNYTFPNNGIIFLDDNVWVDGQINTARLTITAGHFPDIIASRRSITINNDLIYTNYDGQDVIGLIAQKNINVGLISEDDLRIDAALVAQNGRAGRYYYGNGGSAGNCGSTAQRDILTLFGMIATNLRYGFAFTDGTGYDLRYLNYDANLLYGPPPSFPLTSDKYSTVFWEEQK